MLAHALAIHQSVAKKLKKGSANQPTAADAKGTLPAAEIRLTQALFDHIATDDQTVTKFRLKAALRSNVFLKACLAELYECGNCFEFASVVLMEYVKAGLQAPLEIIFFYGYSAAAIEANHATVVSNREATTQLQDFKTWNDGVIINDVWAKTVAQFDKTNKLEAKHLTGDYLKSLFEEETVITIRLEDNLTADEWRETADYLTHAIKLLTSSEIGKQLAKQSLTHLNAETETAKIHARLKLEIADCEKFAKLAANTSAQDSKTQATIMAYEPRVFQPAATSKPNTAQPIEKPSCSIVRK